MSKVSDIDINKATLYLIKAPYISFALSHEKRVEIITTKASLTQTTIERC